MLAALNVNAEDELGECLETWSLGLCEALERSVLCCVAGVGTRMGEEEDLRSRWRCELRDRTLARMRTSVSFEMACPIRIRPLMSIATSFCTSTNVGAATTHQLRLLPLLR